MKTKTKEYSLYKTIKVICHNEEEEKQVAEIIHEMLKGTNDYIENRIIFNMSEDRRKIHKMINCSRSHDPNEVHIYVFDNAENKDFNLKEEDFNMADIGVITEQGFVAGNGLGFNPIAENELNPKEEKEEDE